LFLNDADLAKERHSSNKKSLSMKIGLGVKSIKIYVLLPIKHAISKKIAQRTSIGKCVCKTFIMLQISKAL
jgi:hypothetical protein